MLTAVKIPARILVPVLAALLVVGGVLGLIWWQLGDSADHWRTQLRQRQQSSADGLTAAPDSADTGDQVLIHLRQGDLLALQGDWGEAEKEYEASVKLGGGIPALRKLAQAQMQRRELDQVARTVDQMKAAGARTEDILLLQTIVLLRTGEMVKAKAALDAADDSPQKHYALALLAVIQGDHDTAKAELQTVMGGWDPTLRAYARTLQSAYDEFALFPESRPIHLTTLLSRALAQVQECELALPLLASVVREQDDYRDAWIVQGYCQLTSERTKEALASFERAYALDPEKPEVQYFLGRSYVALGDTQNALTFLRYALENGFQPQSEARKRLGDTAIAAGDMRQAYEQYKALVGDKDADIRTYRTAVTLAIGLQEKTDAYEVARQAVQRWPDEAQSYELLGWAAGEQGNKEEARTDLQKALQMDPNLASAKEKLAKY
jgi:tetratricopeptide (TPR) repeat protein